MENIPLALSVAGLDPSAGAGLYADIKTFSSLGVWGMGVPTTLTIQNSRSFNKIQPVDEDFFRETLNTVFLNNKVSALKIGLITERYQVDEIIRCINSFKPPLVVFDPIVSSSTRFNFWDEPLTNCIVKDLLYLVDVITPNTREARYILEASGDGDTKALTKEELAVNLQKTFRSKIALTGGGDGQDIFYDGMDLKKRDVTFIDIPDYIKHGTGCSFSSALTSYLAIGVDFIEACFLSAVFVEDAIRGAVTFDREDGGMDHFARLR